MIPHFSMLISANPQMEFQAELFVRSLELFGECSNYFFDIFIPENEQIKSNYIKEKANIRTYKPNDNTFLYPWIKPQPRWCLEPKSEICIFVDADMIITSKIDTVIQYCKQSGFYACIANDPPFPLEEWKNLYRRFGLTLPSKMYMYKNCCGDFHSDKNQSVCPFYPNYGFVVVHSKHVENIRKTVIEVIEELNGTHKENYYLPQIAITITLELLKIPTYILPNDFNYITHYNYKQPLLIKNPVIYHYDYKIKKIDDLKYNKKLYEAAVQIMASSIKIL